MPGRTGSHDFSEVVTLLPSAARTASDFAGAPVVPLHGGVSGIAVYVNITAVSGTTPTLSFGFQDSPDGINWYTVVGTATVSAIGQYRYTLPAPLGNFLRCGISILGTTPSFTFSVVAVIE